MEVIPTKLTVTLKRKQVEAVRPMKSLDWMKENQTMSAMPSFFNVRPLSVWYFFTAASTEVQPVSDAAASDTHRLQIYCSAAVNIWIVFVVFNPSDALRLEAAAQTLNHSCS